MSLRNNPDRKGKNHIGAEERMKANMEKRCKVKTCDAYRHNFTGYCSIHGSRYSEYGDPHQVPTRIRGDYMSYYKATLKYIEKHQEELREYLALAEKLIGFPALIKYYDISEMERWFPPIDYRDKGRPVGYKAIETLLRWKKEQRLPKHFLASVIAPHVMNHQEPEFLLSGRPVHMMITRSLMKQCSRDYRMDLEYEWEQGKRKVALKTTYYTNRVGTRDRANVGLRLTSMFGRAIAMVAKEVPRVIDEGAKEYREKLEYYKGFEKMYRDGDQRVTKESLEELRGKLGL